MNVLFINRSYWPDAEATGQLLTELCEDLAKLEHLDVSIICGQPNFNLENLPFKKRGLEIRNNVTIHRVRHTCFNKSTFGGRVTNFVTFLIAATWRALWCPRPDVIIVETDPPLLCLLGWFVSRVRKTKLVCYLQDIYPDIAIKLGRLRTNLFTQLLRWSFLYVYRCSDRVVVVGSDMRRWLINHLVSARRIRTIENWVDTNRVYPVETPNPFRIENHLVGKFIAMYSGNLGYTQRFDLVLDAAEKLKHIDDIVFLIVGNGVRRRELSELVINRGLPNVKFINYQHKSNLANSLSAADAHFVLLDSDLTQLMMPSKIYSALASGTSVIGIGRPKTPLGNHQLDSHLAQTIEINEAGFFVDESQPEKLVEVIEFLYENPKVRHQMGRNARNSAIVRYSRSVTVAEFIKLFADLSETKINVPKPKQGFEPSHLDQPAAVLSGPSRSAGKKKSKRKAVPELKMH